LGDAEWKIKTVSEVSTVDTSVLERKFSELHGALLGNGASEGNLQDALRVEAGQCAWKIAKALGPGTKANAIKQLDKEMLGYFRTTPSTTNIGQESESYADFTWLYASPYALVGINDEDNQTGADAGAVLQMLRGGQKAVPRGNAWVRIGKRGKQVIMRLNRTRVSARAFNGARREIANRFGQSKASFAATAARLLPNKPIPAWVRDKIPTVEGNGKTFLDEYGLASETPSIEFGSRAPGVESNKWMVQKIQDGIESSIATLTKKVERIVEGQTYNFNTGQTFRKIPVEDME
jgi:hypothetical protein